MAPCQPRGAVQAHYTVQDTVQVLSRTFVHTQRYASDVTEPTPWLYFTQDKSYLEILQMLSLEMQSTLNSQKTSREMTSTWGAQVQGAGWMNTTIYRDGGTNAEIFKFILNIRIIHNW